MSDTAHSPLGGTDPEVQDSPQQSTTPELAYDFAKSIVVRHPHTGELSEKTASELSWTMANADRFYEERMQLQRRIGLVEDRLKEALTEVSDDEWIEFIKLIASDLGITLTRRLSITATVEHTFEVEIDLEDDEPTQSDFDFSIGSYEFTPECEDYDVTDFDVTES